VSDALGNVSEAALQLLAIAAALAVPVVLFQYWRASRRYQLVVTELVNSTPDAQLEPATRGLTQLARQRVDAEVRIVARRRESLHAALGVGTHPSRATERVQQRLDDSLGELVSVAREVAPAPARPAIQLLSALVGQPRGLVVAGIIQSRGRVDAARLGISLDVLHVDGNRSLSSQTFWEPAVPDALAAGERVIALLVPAARWVAIRLVVQSVFPRGARGAEQGLDHLLSGVLYAQSADAFGEHAQVFRRRAAEELEQAAELLPSAPLPLAALADTLDRLAAASPDRSASLYEQAHAQYERALGAMPADDRLAATYQIRQATSWLASGLDAPRRRALDWLASEPPDVEHAAATADALYDAACLYALAAGAAEEAATFRDTALRLLARSLAADAAGRRLWEHAARDPHLAPLRADVVAVVQTLQAELASAADADEVVERTLAAVSPGARRV
jgi:hypothetical protein